MKKAETGGRKRFGHWNQDRRNGILRSTGKALVHYGKEVRTPNRTSESEKGWSRGGTSLELGETTPIEKSCNGVKAKKIVEEGRRRILSINVGEKIVEKQNINQFLRTVYKCTAKPS